MGGGGIGARGSVDPVGRPIEFGAGTGGRGVIPAAAEF